MSIKFNLFTVAKYAVGTAVVIGGAYAAYRYFGDESNSLITDVVTAVSDTTAEVVEAAVDAAK